MAVFGHDELAPAEVKDSNYSNDEARSSDQATALQVRPRMLISTSKALAALAPFSFARG